MMPLLRNPLLRDMTTDDLNQRYADSHIQYKGEPLYIYQFVNMGDRVHIEFGPIHLGKHLVQRLSEPFQWDWLNVARPKAGWYVYKWQGKESHFHLSYPNKRQFKRGLCQRNTMLVVPINMAPTTGAYFYAALSNSCPIEVISDDVFEAKRSVIPRRDRALIHYKDTWYFYVAHVHAATIKEGKIIWNYPEFKQELAEVNHSSYLKLLPEEINQRKKAKVNPEWIPNEADRVDEELEFNDAGEVDRINFENAVYHVFLDEEWGEMGVYSCSAIAENFIKTIENNGNRVNFMKTMGKILVACDPVINDRGEQTFPKCPILVEWVTKNVWDHKFQAAQQSPEQRVLSQNILRSFLWNNERYKVMAVLHKVARRYNVVVSMFRVNEGEF